MPDNPNPDEPIAGESQEAPPKYVFFVYIVESPSAPDLYHGRSEGALVASVDTQNRQLVDTSKPAISSR